MVQVVTARWQFSHNQKSPGTNLTASNLNSTSPPPQSKYRPTSSNPPDKTIQESSHCLFVQTSYKISLAPQTLQLNPPYKTPSKITSRKTKRSPRQSRGLPTIFIESSVLLVVCIDFPQIPLRGPSSKTRQDPLGV
jgi:hypothetical protein